MAQVTIRINGYAYTVGCQDGEEEHLLAMANEVERRIETIKVAAGPRALKAAQAGQPMAAPVDPKLGRRLGKLARRAEEIALDLEHP